MPIFNKVNGVYKKADKLYGKVDGVWRQINKSFESASGTWRKTFSGFPDKISGQALGYYRDLFHDKEDHGFKKDTVEEGYVSVDNGGIRLKIRIDLEVRYWAGDLRHTGSSYAKLIFSEPISVSKGSELLLFSGDFDKETYKLKDSYYRIYLKLTSGRKYCIFDMDEYCKNTKTDTNLEVQKLQLMASENLEFTEICLEVQQTIFDNHNDSVTIYASAYIQSIAGESVNGKVVSPITEEYNYDDEDGPNF